MRDLATHESGAEIDLAEPTFDQEILLNVMLAKSKAGRHMHEGELRCRKHGVSVYLRDLPGGVYASHWRGSGISGDHSVALMSKEHRIQQEYVGRAGERAGLDVAFEVPLPTRVRPDLVIGGNTAVEVQRSHLTVSNAKSRTTKAINAGMAISLWISDKEPKHAPKWMYQVPSATAFARDWNTMPPLGSATVTGGLRELTTEPCRPPYRTSCRESGRRYCGKWHLTHQPLRGVSLDALTVGVATGEYLPALVGSNLLLARETDVRRFDVAWIPSTSSEAAKKTPTDERIECQGQAVAPTARRMPDRPVFSPLDLRPRIGCQHWIGEQRRYCESRGEQRYINGWFCENHSPRVIAVKYGQHVRTEGQ